MKVDIKGIIEGTYNKVITTKWIEEVAQERISICSSCEWYSENKKKQGYITHRPDYHCTDCGCNLSLKTRCMSCSCPINKWKEVVDEKDWEKIKLKLNAHS